MDELLNYTTIIMYILQPKGIINEIIPFHTLKLQQNDNEPTLSKLHSV